MEHDQSDRKKCKEKFLKYKSPEKVEKLEDSKTAYGYLNKILPPKITEKDRELFVKCVKAHPSNKSEVDWMNHKLEVCSDKTTMNHSGVCPFRREMFKDILEELIRQIAVECSEKGNFIAKIQAEVDLTMNEFLLLFESGIAHGFRKEFELMMFKKQNKEKMEGLRNEIQHLRFEKEKLLQNLEKLEVSSNLRNETFTRKRKDEILEFKKNQNSLKSQLQEIVKTTFFQ